MNYNTEFQNNNQDLQEILKTVNELPDAGGGVTDAVRYGEQTLTEEQKAQARENIGIVGTGKDGEDGTSIHYVTIPLSSIPGDSGEEYYFEFEDDPSLYEIGDLVIDINSTLYRVISKGTDTVVCEILGSIKGEKGDTGDNGDTYALTSTDKNAIAAAVKSSLPTLSMVGTDEDGVEHTWTIYGS